MFEFANRHHFWDTNIKSPSKLRKQWSKLVDDKRKESRPIVRPNEPPAMIIPKVTPAQSVVYAKPPAFDDAKIPV